MKFQLSEIVIKTPGVQLREKIIEKYGSIRAFADAIDLYESSIVQYLSSKKLGSSTFKIRTMNAFETDFNDLFRSDEDQIRYFTSQVSWYIEEYVYKEDIEILEKLKMICLEYGLLEDYAIVCRSYAHFYMNQGKYNRAKAYIDVAVNTMRDRENIDRFGLYLSDKILIEAADMTRPEFRKIVEEFNSTLEQVKGPLTRGHMYANLGQAYFDLGEYQLSKKMFEHVFQCHEDNKSQSFVFLRLGDIEKALNHHDAAFGFYKKAETLLDKSDETIYYVYDEYAAYYLSKGMLTEAEAYIDRIFNNSQWKISASKSNKLDTYIRVKLACNKEDAVIDIIHRLMGEIKESYIYAMHHLSLIDSLISTVEMTEGCLERISRQIISFYKNYTVDEDDTKMLKQLLGSIVLTSNS